MQIRRSSHFVPGANEKMLLKSLATEADSLILDLEDAVTPENKDSARKIICEWLDTVDFAEKEKVVRINPIGTDWGNADVEELMEHPPDAFLVPKVNTASELRSLDERMTRAEQIHGHSSPMVKLLVLGTETPMGTLNIQSLPQCPRVDALSWGAEDLSAAIGARRNRDENNVYLDVFRYSRVVTLLAATAAGVQPLDTVYVNYSDPEGLRVECRESADVGFTGKMTIHPSQIEIVNETFTPTAEQISEAEELLQCAKDNHEQGIQAFSFKGQMVDVPHLTQARHILEMAKALKI